MKKLQLVLIFVVIGCYTAISQVSITKECVFCKDNEVYYKKYASAVGQNNIASGEASFAGGFGNKALDNYSIALGYNSIAGGLHSISLGSESQANGVYSIAIGRKAFATSPNAVAIGKYIESAVPSSFSFGTYLSNNAGFSFVIGKGAGNSYRLVNGIDNTLMIGFNSTLPTFFVSPSANSDKTGRIGIGNITSPEAKLHIKADNNEDAAIMLQPTGSGYYAKILFGENSHQIFGKAGESFTFETEEGQDFLFKNGDIQLQSGYQLKTEKVSSLSDKLQLSDDIGGITITNGGKVGIGTSSPSYSLMVIGNMSISSEAVFLNSITQSTGNYFATSQIKSPDANGLTLTDLNDNGIFVKDGGNVGIGTTNPGEKLDVAGTIQTTGFRMSTNSFDDYVLTCDAGGNGTWTVPSQIDDGDWTINGNNIYSSNSGNVGIGIETPLERLQLGDRWTFHNGGTKIIGYNYNWDGTSKRIVEDEVSTIQFTGNGNILFRTALTGVAGSAITTWNNPLTLLNEGNVGIGTSTPTEKLEVDGNILQTPGYNVSTNQIKAPDANGLNLTDLTGNGIFVEDGGNIGIGTTTPNYILDVTGDINFTGNLLHNELPFETSKWDENWNDIYYDGGNVGIGTSTPSTKLEVRGTTTLDYNNGNNAGNALVLKSGDEQLKIVDVGDGDYSIIGNEVNNTYIKSFDNSGTEGESIFLNKNGGVGIGTPNVQSGYKLTVAGKIISEDVKVVEEIGADFVFADDYPLPKLEDVEKYIEKNKHLPEIPSAEEMKTNGLEIGDMQIKLLQKVEELTLYMIDQQKMIKKQQQQIEKQNSEIEKLKDRMQ